LVVDTKINEAVIAAQNITLQLQTQLFDIRDKFEEQAQRLQELRERLEQYDDFETNAPKYQLDQTMWGVLAYRLKDPQQPIERTLRFCAHCFTNRKIRMLQNNYCHECKFSRSLMKGPRERPSIIRKHRLQSEFASHS
jgi:hypothetical protein